MWTKEQWFSGLIRCVFIFAFGAFLWASIHHVATFYHNFEPADSDWTGSYALAISVDATALVLTIGVMFFGRNMPKHAKCFVWFFIFALTALSWVVNWQYARRYQAMDLTQDSFWLNINPILASSFAFLNLAYSVIGEFFNTRVKTAEELQKELDALNARADLEKQLRERKSELRGPGLIERAKNVAIEAKQAVKEVTAKEEKVEESPAKTLPSQAALSTQIEEVEEEITDEDIASIFGSQQRSQAEEEETEVFASDGSRIEEAMEAEAEAEMEGPATDPEITVEEKLRIVRKDEQPTGELLDTGCFRLSGRKPITTAEAAAALGVTERSVREMKKNGRLKAPASDNRLVTVASVNAVLAEKQKKLQSAREMAG